MLVFNKGICRITNATLYSFVFLKQAEIWQLRERIAESLLKDGYCYKYDISLPLSVFYDSITVMRERLEGQVTRVVGYGHIGDGNMHLNITTPEYSQQVRRSFIKLLMDPESIYKIKWDSFNFCCPKTIFLKILETNI